MNARYDGALHMLIEDPRDARPEALAFMRWLVARGVIGGPEDGRKRSKTMQTEEQIQAWIDRPTSHECVTHNDPRGRECVEFYMRTPGGSVTYLYVKTGPAPERHAQTVRVATMTSSGYAVSRWWAAQMIRTALAGGFEVTCRRHRYEAAPGPIAVRYGR